MGSMITQKDKLKLRSFEEDLERKEEAKEDVVKEVETVDKTVTMQETKGKVKEKPKEEKRSRSDAKELISALKEVAEKKNYASLEDLDDMPLNNYQDYLD